MLFYLILALHETADRAVSARCGPGLIAIEAEEVGQSARTASVVRAGSSVGIAGNGSTAHLGCILPNLPPKK